MRSSGYYSTDISLFKVVPIGKERTLTFRAEAFNVFNIINYGVPGVDLSNAATFGVVSSMTGAPRQIQLGIHGRF
jgi:hypothetical protein